MALGHIKETPQLLVGTVQVSTYETAEAGLAICIREQDEEQQVALLYEEALALYRWLGKALTREPLPDLPDEDEDGLLNKGI